MTVPMNTPSTNCYRYETHGENMLAQSLKDLPLGWPFDCEHTCVSGKEEIIFLARVKFTLSLIPEVM